MDGIYNQGTVRGCLRPGALQHEEVRGKIRDQKQRLRSLQQCKRKTRRGDITEAKRRVFLRKKWSAMLKAAERSSKRRDNPVTCL